MAQSQASLNDQLRELYRLANQNGLYDAADVIRYNLLGEPKTAADWEEKLRKECPDGYSLSSS